MLALMLSARLNGWYLNTFSALKHRPYRAFWVSQLISLVGGWIQATAQQYLVLELSGNNSIMLAWVATAQFLPSLLFSLFAGAIIDRSSRRRVLLATQSTLLLVAIALAVLTHSGLISVPLIMLLAFVGGVANAFDMPARQSMVLDFVPKAEVSNAIALNSLAFNVSRTLGQALFGLVAAWGVFVLASGQSDNVARLALPFYFNIMSFLGVIIVIWRLPFPEREQSAERPKTLEQIKQGLQYVRQTPTVLYVMLLVGGMSLSIINFNVILPYYARAVFGSTEGLFGLMSAAFGVGAMAGALLQASKPKPIQNLRLGGIFLILGGSLLAFVPTAYFAMPVLMLCGAAMLLLLTSANSTIQLTIPDHMRGRVMSLYSFVLIGMGPPGSLLTGKLLDKQGLLGPRYGLLVLVLLALLVLVLLWPKLPRKLLGLGEAGQQ